MFLLMQACDIDMKQAVEAGDLASMQALIIAGVPVDQLLNVVSVFVRTATS